MKLEGKVVLITGASPNIMGGIAEAMANEGASIVAVDVNPEFANGMAAGIEKQGGKALSVVCDVSKEAQVQSTIARAKEAFGGVDVLVHGAVIQIRKGLLDMPYEEYRRQIEVILGGVFLFSKYTAQLMIDQGRGGNIIVIASTEAHQGTVDGIGYGTAKSGLLNFARATAMELSEYGIRVNTLTPTATDSAEGLERAKRWGVQWGRPPSPAGLKLMEARRKAVPLQQFPSSSDYGKAAVFLASDDARMITGIDLRVDAGNIARYWGWMPDKENPLNQRTGR